MTINKVTINGVEYSIPERESADELADKPAAEHFRAGVEKIIKELPHLGFDLRTQTADLHDGFTSAGETGTVVLNPIQYQIHTPEFGSPEWARKLAEKARSAAGDAAGLMTDRLLRAAHIKIQNAAVSGARSVEICAYDVTDSEERGDRSARLTSCAIEARFLALDRTLNALGYVVKAHSKDGFVASMTVYF